MDASVAITDGENPAENSILRLKRKYINKSREAMRRRHSKHDFSNYSFSSRSHAHITEPYKRKIDDLLLNNNDLAKSLETAHLEMSKLEQEVGNLQRQLSYKESVQSKLTKVSSNLSIIASLIDDTVTSIMDAKKLITFSSDSLEADTPSGENLSTFEIPPVATYNPVNNFNNLENTDSQQSVWKPCRPIATLDMSIIPEETTRNLAQFLQITVDENSDSPLAISATAEEVKSTENPDADHTAKLSIENVASSEKQSTPQNKELEISRETPKTPVLSSNPQFLPSLIPKPVRYVKQKFLGRDANDNSSPIREEMSASEKLETNENTKESTIGKVPLLKKVKSKHGITTMDISQKVGITDNVKHNKITDRKKCKNDKESCITQKHDENINSVKSHSSNSSPDLSIPPINRKTYFIPNKSPISHNRKTFVISREPKRLDSICELDANLPKMESPSELSSQGSQQNNADKGNNNSGELTQIILHSSKMVSDVDVQQNIHETIGLSHPINRIDELVEFEESTNDAILAVEEISKFTEFSHTMKDPSAFQMQKESSDVTILKSVDMELTEALPSSLINRHVLGLTSECHLLTATSTATSVLNTGEQVMHKDNVEMACKEIEINKEEKIISLEPPTIVINEHDCHTGSEINNNEPDPDTVAKATPAEKRPRRKPKQNYKMLLDSPDISDLESKPLKEDKNSKAATGKSKNPTKASGRKPKNPPSAKGTRGRKKKTPAKEQLLNEGDDILANTVTNEGKENVESRKRRADIYDVFVEEMPEISPYKSRKMEQAPKNENKHDVSSDLFGDDKGQAYFPVEPVNSLKTDVQNNIQTPQIAVSTAKKTSGKSSKGRKPRAHASKAKIKSSEKENEHSFSDFNLEPPKTIVFATKPKKQTRSKSPLKLQNSSNKKADTEKKLKNALSPLNENFAKDRRKNSFEIQDQSVLKVTSPTGQSIELPIPGTLGKLSTSVRTPSYARGSLFQHKNSVSMDKSPSIVDSCRGRRNKQVSYREPTLNQKLRRP